MIRSYARWVRSRVQSLRRLSRGPTILLYHRINTAPTDASGMYVSPEHFREHLDVLTRRYRVVTLGALAAQCRDGTAPRNSVALTFDDGYRDTLEIAYPMLESFDAPATFFITTGRVQKERDYWWDELERVVLRTTSLPPSLTLRVGSQTREWHAGAGWDSDKLESERKQIRARSRRQQLFDDLHAVLIESAEPQQLDIQDQLVSWAGSAKEPQEAVLSGVEVAILGASSLAEIGAHSVNHPVLPRLPRARQVAEMRESREWLEDTTGCSVKSFAYPHGVYDDVSMDAARSAGFTVACTCDSRRVSRRHSQLALPRLEAGDVDGDQFARALRWLQARQ